MVKRLGRTSKVGTSRRRTLLKMPRQVVGGSHSGQIRANGARQKRPTRLKAGDKRLGRTSRVGTSLRRTLRKIPRQTWVEVTVTIRANEALTEAANEAERT